jgi:hypothetical protein
MPRAVTRRSRSRRRVVTQPWVMGSTNKCLKVTVIFCAAKSRRTSQRQSDEILSSIMLESV